MDPPSQMKARPLATTSIQPCGPPCSISLPAPEGPGSCRSGPHQRHYYLQAVTFLDFCYNELTIIFLFHDFYTITLIKFQI